MNDAELSERLSDISKRLSAFSVVLSMDDPGIALTLNSMSSELASISEDLIGKDEACRGVDWNAIRDALAAVRPDLSMQIDRCLEGAVRRSRVHSFSACPAEGPPAPRAVPAMDGSIAMQGAKRCSWHGVL